MAKVKSVVDTILGEATYGTPQQRYADMVNIASVIANRAAQTRTTPQQVVSVRSEFNAFGKPLPSGASAYRNLAQKAWDQVQTTGPVHGATFYATPKAAKNLPKGLQQVTSTSGHVYFSDPQNRAIRTAAGVIKPVANAVRQVANTVGNVADAVTSPVRQVAAGVGNMASALRTAAFPSMSPAPRPSMPVGNNPFGSYSRANLTPGISNALDVLSYAPQAANIGINSGYRSPTTNAKAGGAGRSQHLHGNAVDIDISRLSPAERTSLLDLAIEKGNVKGVGVYPSGNSLHIDTRANPMAWGPSPRGKYSGLSPKELDQLPEWAQDSIKGMYQAGQYQVTPRTTAPTPTARPTTPDSLMAAPLGKVERAPLQAAAPRAPDAARFGYDTMPNPERFGPRAPTATAKVDRLPASSIPEPDPARFAYDVNPAPAKPAGLGLVTPAAASIPASPNAGMSLAQQYASYGAGRVQSPTPALNAMMSPNVGPLPQSINPVAGSLMAPVSLPSLQPPAPVPVTTPKAPRLMTPNQRIDQAFKTAAVPAAPQFTASDVYQGRANSGLASDGSTVSRDMYGNTTVENRFGARTTTLPNGSQAASFGGPGIGGPLGGNIGSVFDARPDLNGRSQFGNKARQVGAGMAGSMVGGMLGPVGSLIGAAIATDLARPGGGLLGDLARGTRTIDTSKIGTLGGMVFGPTTQFARPQSGGPFPNAPTGRPGSLGGRESNLTDRQMRDISPRAADAISKGVGGLY